VPVPGKIELVCFDLGRVLVRLPTDWKHACEIAGVAPPQKPADAAALAAINEINARYDIGQIDLEAFAREAAPHSGLAPQDLVRMQGCFLLGAFPGVTELIDDLSRAGVRTACLSNTSDHHWRMMHDPQCPAYLPLDRLDYRFASHLLRLRKPGDAIYAHVEQTAGVPGGAIVFFDDLPENVDAAKARGWHAYRVDPASDNPIPQIRRWLAGHGVLR
jgi:FMN phosphatase YigB (HAD superfamily)